MTEGNQQEGKSLLQLKRVLISKDELSVDSKFQVVASRMCLKNWKTRPGEQVRRINGIWPEVKDGFGSFFWNSREKKEEEKKRFSPRLCESSPRKVHKERIDGECQSLRS